MTAPTVQRYTLTKGERISRPQDFTRVRRRGRKQVGRFIVAWALTHSNESPARLGILIGRRHGNAVKRNLFKRRIREIFRLSKYDLPLGFDLVITPRLDRSGPKASAFPQNYEDLKNDFLKLTRRLADSASSSS